MTAEENARDALARAEAIADREGFDTPEGLVAHGLAVAQVWATLAVAEEIGRLFAEGLTTTTYNLQP